MLQLPMQLEGFAQVDQQPAKSDDGTHELTLRDP